MDIKFPVLFYINPDEFPDIMSISDDVNFRISRCENKNSHYKSFSAKTVIRELPCVDDKGGPHLVHKEITLPVGFTYEPEIKESGISYTLKSSDNSIVDTFTDEIMALKPGTVELYAVKGLHGSKCTVHVVDNVYKISAKKEKKYKKNKTECYVTDMYYVENGDLIIKGVCQGRNFPARKKKSYIDITSSKYYIFNQTLWRIENLVVKIPKKGIKKFTFRIPYKKNQHYVLFDSDAIVYDYGY